MNRKFEEYIAVLGAIVLFGIAGGMGAYMADTQRCPARGKIQNERVFEIPTFGKLYEVYLKDKNGYKSRHVFLGSEDKLNELDRNFNKGDYVKINPRTTTMSLTDPILSPEQIRLVR